MPELKRWILSRKRKDWTWKLSIFLEELQTLEVINFKGNLTVKFNETEETKIWTILGWILAINWSLDNGKTLPLDTWKKLENDHELANNKLRNLNSKMNFLRKPVKEIKFKN